jgi:hypothetical protein
MPGSNWWRQVAAAREQAVKLRGGEVKEPNYDEFESPEVIRLYREMEDQKAFNREVQEHISITPEKDLWAPAGGALRHVEGRRESKRRQRFRRSRDVDVPRLSRRVAEESRRGIGMRNGKDRLDRIEEGLAETERVLAKTREILRVTALQTAENAKQIQASRRKEHDREMKASHAEHDRDMREIRALFKQMVRRIAS